MAEEFDAKTEAPTPRRREEARTQGRVAFSTDLLTGVILLAATGALSFGAGKLGIGLLNETRVGLLSAAQTDLSTTRSQALFGRLFGQCLTTIGPLLGLLVAVALGACLVQAGFQFNPALLGIDWQRVSPFEGGRIFSWNNTVKAGLALLRLIAVGLLAWWVLAGHGENLGRLSTMHLGPAIGLAWGIVTRLALAISGGLLLLGMADYWLQYWRLEQSLRMSRQEIKDETKREEGDPQVKIRIRRLQREAARKKMFHEVRHATAVVTNPTHLAVALRYDRGGQGAPRVVAKGAGHVALRIAELARRHGVPVLERKSLAQALFRSVKLNQEIPMALYHTVAEVLAFVYRAREPWGSPPPRKEGQA